MVTTEIRKGKNAEEMGRVTMKQKEVKIRVHNQSDTKSSPNPNPNHNPHTQSISQSVFVYQIVVKQHVVQSIQLNVVACPTIQRRSYETT